MSSVVVSPRAAEDLNKIWDYTAEQWNTEQAERYTRAIWTAIEILAEAPDRGRACDEIRTGYKRHSVGSHVIFFRLTKDGIDIVRILSQRMDFEQHL